MMPTEPEDVWMTDDLPVTSEDIDTLREAIEEGRGLSEEEIRADERRKVAEQIRQFARWDFAGGFADLLAFLERHPGRGFEHLPVPILAALLGALADEVEGDVLRQTRGTDNA